MHVNLSAHAEIAFTSHFTVNAANSVDINPKSPLTPFQTSQFWTVRRCVTWQRFGRRQFGVAAGRVNTADLNEPGHQHDESDSHQQNRPPVSLRHRDRINTRSER